MVVISKIISNSDLIGLTAYNEINASLKQQQDCSSNIEYFVVIEDKTILGHASITLHPNISMAQIDEIYILPQKRNQGLGDSLLRAVLNYSRINFCIWAIIKGHQNLDEFLISKDIKGVDYDNMPIKIRDAFTKDWFYNCYICNLESFFNKKCKGDNMHND